MSVTLNQVETLLHDAEAVAPATPTTRPVPQPTSFEWIFVITGGLMVFLPFILLIGEHELAQEEHVHWYFWLSVLIGSPHVYSTYVRQHRKIREGRSSAWLGIPAYLAIVVALTLLHRGNVFVETITLVNVWQSFHYLRQAYGVGCLYGGQKTFDHTDRRLRWWAYHFTFPWLIIGRWDMLYDAWGGQSYELIPVNFDAAFMRFLGAVALIGVYTQIVAEIRLIRRNGRNYRPTGLICYVVCLGIHYYGFMILTHFQRGFEAVTFYHAMQYLALVWVLERRQRSATGNSWITAIPNLAGFALFWLVLYLLGFGWEQYLTTALERWWVIASTILLSSISVHHYIVDSFLWRRSVGA
ncbi:MAG: hypothetical protein KDA96_05975 [Planctomycetaceae bacterium]|nr:hypothetical protein [Planctomycetaceae bacterium]